jgi:predicted acetyltransferase
VSLTVRTVHEPDELREFATVHATAFGYRWEQEKLEKLMVPSLQRVNCVAAFDGGEMIGVSVDQPFQMTVPGGRAVPMRGLTWAGVLPTHRRRGALRAMFDRQHADMREQGLLVSGLFAAATTIYHRFGYGAATLTVAEAEVDSNHGAFALPIKDPGRIELLRDPSPVAVVREVLERSRLQIPGELDRDDADIADMFAVAEHDEFRIAHRAAGGYDGFASYRVKSEWTHEVLPQGQVQVQVLLTAAPEAAAAIWRYLLDVELTTSVQIYNRPLDDPIRWLLAEWRYHHVKQIADGLWLSLLDAPAALEARRYLADGELVLELDGAALLLEVRDGEGSCTPTGREPEIALDAPALASTFLGGYRFSALREAMRLRELVPGACLRADSMFRAEREPWCSYEF